MTNEQIQALINTIETAVQANSITPQILASVLRAIQDFANSQQQVQPATIAALQTQINQLEAKKGAPDGYATLDASGIIPATQLPSYVDDVIEYEKQVSGSSWLTTALSTPTGTTLWNATAASNLSGGTSNKYYHKFITNTNGTEAGLKITDPEAGKIYVCLVDNFAYRWSGSTLVEVSKSIGLGETASTAYPGNKGKELATDLNKLIDNFNEFVEATKKDLSLIKDILKI